MPNGNIISPNKKIKWISPDKFKPITKTPKCRRGIVHVADFGAVGNGL